jgi:microcystin-dependent protein
MKLSIIFEKNTMTLHLQYSASYSSSGFVAQYTERTYSNTYVWRLGMTDCYLGEIRVFPFNWAPHGWALCSGQTMAINQYQALYALLGIYYGGDGKNTFQLPDMRGRTRVGAGLGPEGVNYGIGYKAGAETVTLSPAQMPSHNHYVAVSSAAATTNDNADAYFAQTQPVEGHNVNMYAPPVTPVVVLDGTGTTVMNNGGGKAHTNLQPYMVLNFCIAITGLFPPRSDY